MKIFDSLKNTKWKGRGLDIRTSSILALKSANFSQSINIKAGKYIVKIVGKKRTGNGKIIVEILSDQNKIFLREEINFSSNSWSEHTLSFHSNKNIGSGKIRFTRERNVYGSIELGRIYVDLTEDLPIPNISSIAKSRRRKNNVIKNLASKKENKRLFAIESEFMNLDKKIAFIIPYHIYGGAEVYIQNIINRIKNCKITILYMKPNNLQNYITNSNVIHRVVKGPTQFNGILKANDYDYIVYYNRADIYSWLIHMKADQEITSKLIEIYHSDFVWAGAISALKTRPGIDKLIAISNSLALNIKEINTSKRAIIPVGIDLERFKARDQSALKARLGIDSHKPIIGTVARLSKEKQVGYLISLALEMPKFEFVIVGDGPEKGTILSEIKRLNLSNIRLVGYKKDPAPLYNIFDAFVLASKIEGTPISIIEAMASGVPVFSNMVGAIPDLISENVTGFRITEDPVKDSEIIRANMDNLKVIQSARKYVEENHDISKVHFKFIELLISLNNFFMERHNNESLLLTGEYI